MTAKEYLLQARSIKIKLEAMAEQLEFLRSAAECVTPRYSDMPKPATRNVHKNEDAIIRVLDYEEKITETQRKLTEVTAVIDKVDDPTQNAILIKRYLSNKTWDEIASDLFICVAHVHRLHKDALVIIEKMRENETK